MAKVKKRDSETVVVDRDSETVVVNLKNTLKKNYSIRKSGPGKSMEVNIPPETIEREAKAKGMTPEQYIETHQAEIHFNSFRGLLIQFSPKVERVRQVNRKKANEK